MNFTLNNLITHRVVTRRRGRTVPDGRGVRATTNERTSQRRATREMPPRTPLDALRERLTCPLCSQLYTDPTTLPCAHTHCLECATSRMRGHGIYSSACAECEAPTAMKDLSVNQTLKSFVENFKSVDARLTAALEAVGAFETRVEEETARVSSDEERREEEETETEAMDVDEDEREKARRECLDVAERIRRVDELLREIDARLARARAEARSAPATQSGKGTQPSLDFEGMNLTQLRGTFRDIYGSAPDKRHKKPWFLRHFASLDVDVLAAALASTQAEENANKIVIAYSASARRRSTESQDEKFASVERMVKSIDSDAVFMGVRDLTADVTHLIMDTGSSERIVRNRTAKYIEAIARGIYIVHKDWLDDCVERGSFGNEEAFELEDATSQDAGAQTDGPRRARLAKLQGARGLFDGSRICVKGCGALSVSALENILSLAGAAIFHPPSPTPRRSPRGAIDTDQIPDSEDEGDDGVAEDVITLVDQERVASSGKNVSWRWALECITRFELLPTDKWVVEMDH